MIEVIFKIFLTDYIDFQGFITKRIQKPLLIEYKKKEYEKAIADYTQSLKMDVEQADVYYNRGIACHYARQKNEACVNLKTAISLGYQIAQAAYNKLCN
jgi:tetratricopeptide (TPR) repeat protein